MTILMVPPKIARKQWDCPEVVTEMLLFFRPAISFTGARRKILPTGTPASGFHDSQVTEHGPGGDYATTSCTICEM
jgi:hypothetical protein